MTPMGKRTRIGTGAWTCLGRRSLAFTILFAMGCGVGVDPYGVDERVIETEALVLAEESLSDKAPAYDPELTVTEVFDHGCEFTLNKSASVTKLTIQEFDDADAELEERLFPTRAEALTALGSRLTTPSMEVVNGALKPFNDGLYAAIELLAEAGASGAQVSKKALIDELLSELLKAHEAAPTDEGIIQAAGDFAAAVAAGEQPRSSLPTAVATAADNRLAGFNQDPFQSKPIGFYTWTPELKSIFRRDRLLMTPFFDDAHIGAMAALLGVVAEQPDLRDAYDGLLHLQAGLTNPPMAYSPMDVFHASEASAGATPSAWVSAFVSSHPDVGADPTCQRPFSWLPYARSPETELGRKLACSGGFPSSLLEALISAIQSGQIDLTPTADSGWYDRQLYALETLLVPELAPEYEHLLLTQEYKEKLVETFKSLIIQTRETHAKSLGGVATKGGDERPSVELYPQLPVEPFPTFYLRTARAYAFVDTFLRATLGESALESTGRLLESGQRAKLTLAEELTEKRQLLYGLHLVASASIGMRPSLSDEELAQIDTKAAEATARSWILHWRDDADVLRDPRLILPVASDGDGAVLYWAVAGVKILRMHASYPEGYEPEIVEGGCEAEGFVPYEPYLLVEQSLELTLPSASEPLDRDEFRAIADKADTLSELKDALGAQP